MQTELLAPAKDKYTAFAAIDCGADAVYIGSPAFGARKNASNSIEDIKEVVDYAHKFWAKVFVTLNTILTDAELNEAVELTKKLANIGVDAIIVQDMGLLSKIKNLPIHISTQCHNFDSEKIKFFNDIGISRVVLARETTLEQIKKIHKENPNLELEAFVHGALCVSMSGQCYLSEYIGGRSANRGECAQPCRKKYSVETTDGEIIRKDFYALCLKDFNASKLINEMIDAGVYSFKIEGRLKDISYVKNVVSYYRNELGKGISSGKTNAKIYPLEKSFNRGFTTYFLKGREECFSPDSPKSKGEYLGKVIEVKNDCFKIKTSIELHPQDGLYFNDGGCLVNKVITPPQPSPSSEGAILIVYPNHKVNLKVGDKIYRNLDIEFEKEISKPVKRQIGVYLGTLPGRGGLGWGDLILIDEDGVSITVKLPDGEKAINPEKMKDTFVKQFSKTGESDFYIEDIKIATELPFMPVSEINNLRRELFKKLMDKRLEVYNLNKEKGRALTIKPYYIKEIDYRANVHNNSAKEFYENIGVDVKEMSFESKKPTRQVSLMRCKHCIKYALNMCKSPKNLVLRDEYNNIYPLKFNCKDCEMEVLSPKL